MRVAVIGGGLFGCTTAIQAARAGHQVHLYESGPEIMLGATSGSYNRLHRGYHYPRSPETGRESLRAEASFRQEYGEAVIDGGTQLYAVADGGLVTGEDFQVFLEAMNLRYRKIEQHPLIEVRGWVFEVEEPRIDPSALLKVMRRRLLEAGVNLHIGTPAPADLRRSADVIVVAAYARTNEAQRVLGLPVEPYKFQVVEKPIVLMPPGFKDTSIVVLDGPFCCLDPHGLGPHHVLGHVVETVHHTNVGLYPEVPEDLRQYIGSGCIIGFGRSRIKRVIDGMSRFIPKVLHSEYVGSVMTLRAVLPDRESTDERPTLVQRLDSQVIRIFSGKMGTAVTAAREAVNLIRAMDKVRAVA